MRSWQGGRARHLASRRTMRGWPRPRVRLSEWTGRALWRARALGAATSWSTCSGTTRRAASSRPAAMRRPGRPTQGVSRRRRPGHQLHRSRRTVPRRRFRRRRGSTRRSSGRSRWPDRSSTSTPLRSPTWWRPCPCGAARRDRGDGDRPDLLAEIRRRWLPAAVVVWGEPDDGPLFEGRPPQPGLAYVCQARSCQMRRRTPRPWPPNWRRLSDE